MARICPETNTPVLYLDCLDCESKSCKSAPAKKDERELHEKKKRPVSAAHAAEQHIKQVPESMGAGQSPTTKVAGL